MFLFNLTAGEIIYYVTIALDILWIPI